MFLFMRAYRKLTLLLSCIALLVGSIGAQTIRNGRVFRPRLAPVTATTTVLTSSAAPSAFGASLTLTATVSPSTATGRVTFYDGEIVLETSAVTSGVATLTTRLLPSGTQSLRAYYQGNSAYAPSGSPVLAQTVNAVPANGFTAEPLYTNISASGPVADFNGDGIPDLVVAQGIQVGVALGNGDGSFQTPAAYYNVGSTLWSTAVGDFNGDGNMDIVISDGLCNAVNATEISILFGTGSGGFQPVVHYAVTASCLDSVAVADLNGDGLADIAAADAGGNISVLLGNGDSTFQTPVNYSAGEGLQSVAVGDFNGDGKADLVAASSFGGVGVLIGNGDGTFLSAASYSAPGYLSVVTVADLNGDGKADLALFNAISGSTVVTILLGNGDGSFEAPANYYVSPGYGFVVADLNGDGKIDIAVGNQYGGVGELLGNGDGTFQNPLYYSPLYLSVPLAPVAVGDFNGDGRADLALLFNESPTTSVLLGAVQPVAAFLEQDGSPALTVASLINFPDAGGSLISAPAVAQAPNGETYVAGLDSAGGVHLNSFYPAWNGWQYSGGILDTTSGLTATVAPDGVVWFTGRDIGNRYWINSWNGTGFGGWILVADGIFSGDSIPQIAITSDGTIWIVGKDIGGRIWSNSYNPSNQSFSGWVDRQAVMIGQPSVAAGQDGFVYVAVRSVPSNSPVYITQIPADNANTANTWLNGGGQIDSDPQITSQGGTVYLMALAGGGTAYLLTFSEATQTYGAWNFTNGVLNDATIAAAAGNVFIAGRDTADRIFWYSLAGNSWTVTGEPGLSFTALTGGK
jgi:hypothetical protein